MKRKFLVVLLAIVATFCMAFGLAACGGGFKAEGTYYFIKDNEMDKKTYFTLKDGKWTDEEGSSGDYEIEGEKIIFYTDLFGERIEFTNGTLKDGVLKLQALSESKVFAQEGAWKGSNSGNQSGTTPSAKEYTVIYNANGGSFADGKDTYTQTVKDGTKLTAPTSPMRSNYTFAGWAKSKNGSIMWKFDEDTVSETTTLYAQWTQESAIILSVEGASIEDREIFMLVDHATGEVSLSGKVVCSDDSIWRLYSDPEGQREIPTKMVTNLSNGDNKYYIVVNSQNQAQVNVYELIVHRSFLVTVSYYDDENLLETAETYTGEEFTASYKPEITGYTFNGWKTRGGASFTSDVIWGATALYAEKTPKTYKATFDVNGGDALTETEKTVTYDSEYSLPVPERIGYSFAGWYLGSLQITNASGKSLAIWNYTRAQEFTAHWEANKYKVTLNVNDKSAGTVKGGGDHTYESQVTITATTNIGYNFLGWYDKDDKLVTDKEQYTFIMGFGVSYTAKFQLKPEMQNFIFASTETTCTVTGVKNKGLTELVVPEYVTEINEGALFGCTKIESLSIPFVGNGSNKNKSHLGYTFGASKYEENSKYVPVSLKKVTITGVTSIEDFAFNGCSGLNSVIIGNGVTVIGACVFYGCSGLTSITIPESVTGISYLAFRRCSGLVEIKVDKNNKTYHAEGNCLIETKSKALISGCKTSAIPDDGSVTYIVESAFMDCISLKKIVIPNSVTTIGKYAFEGCSGLTSVTIGNSVTLIGEYAFSGCSGLKEVYFENPNGWKVSGYSDMRNAKDVSGLDDPATAAKYLTSSYDFYYWKREG